MKKIYMFTVCNFSKRKDRIEDLYFNLKKFKPIIVMTFSCQLVKMVKMLGLS